MLASEIGLNARFVPAPVEAVSLTDTAQISSLGGNMPSKSPRNEKTKAAEAPSAATNFRQIKGINQLSEARLHRAGIKTFEDLANLQPEEILAALGNPKGISVKQIVEQDWIGQARKLSGKKAAANGTLESEGFIVNLFLSKRKQAHSTQVLHVSSDEGEKWDGWDSQRLLDFITKRSGLVLPKVDAVKVSPPAPEPTQESIATTSIPVVEPPPAQTGQPDVSATELLSEAEPTPAPLEPEVVLRAFEVVPIDSDLPRRLLRKGEPFNVRLFLDAEKVTPQFATSLDYTASIFAKGLDVPQQFRLGEVRGVLADPNNAIVVNIPKQDFAPGTYRLEAALTISKESQTIGHPARARTILQVF